MRYALKFGYNGKGFSGYARQPDLRTVEGEIIEALKKTQVIMDRDDTRFQSASRTDKDVSARGNVIALNTDFRKEEILGALNAHLEDVWFYGLAEVDEGFNPRHARQRWYRYFLIDEEIDEKKIRECARIFEGKHDFSNFARVEDKDPTRIIKNIDVIRHNETFIFDFRAQSFLWHMVRRIMKALVDASKDVISINDIIETLDVRENVDLGIAPPEPLILMDVEYDFDIPVNEEQLVRVKENIQKLLLDMRIQNTILEQIMNI